MIVVRHPRIFLAQPQTILAKPVVLRMGSQLVTLMENCARMADSEDEAAEASVRKAYFFDFDSTLSVCTFLQARGTYAVADKTELFAQMSTAEIIQNFGGQERIRQLDELLTYLGSRDITLFIISIGFIKAIRPHLEAIGLAHHFQTMWGQDSPELQEVKFTKGLLIEKIMKVHGWARDDCVFIDDSKDHIDKCNKLNVCETFHVKQSGLTEADLARLRELA
mmetsp:Transcript_20077/g.46160  ORF Transcript_20077/g.46160 Transcript_20077/m.46160 type:complete len:222 (+) Transcript_20077:35-700(+)